MWPAGLAVQFDPAHGYETAFTGTLDLDLAASLRANIGATRQYTPCTLQASAAFGTYLHISLGFRYSLTLEILPHCHRFPVDTFIYQCCAHTIAARKACALQLLVSQSNCTLDACTRRFTHWPIHQGLGFQFRRVKPLHWEAPCSCCCCWFQTFKMFVLMLCTAFPAENTEALFAISTRFRIPNRARQSGSLIRSAYLQHHCR